MHVLSRDGQWWSVANDEQWCKISDRILKIFLVFVNAFPAGTAR